ncbi:MAG: 2-hydroxyacyl-CoA dehydratase [Candidatus Omnitrophica bacterium]|nr:2-hydroxyacyl-CoA dehydratase [Candidatus Omnitrophota bacterium]
MAGCCGTKDQVVARAQDGGPLEHFAGQVQNCLAYARLRKSQGAPVVGIMCEFTPRELIMAAGGVPVCLCGGSAEMVEPAERVLPANLCPLIKSTFGYSLEKANPFLEMASLVVAETTCDGKKKMYELLGQRHPMYVLELPQKSRDADAFEHWVAELRKLRKELEARFAVEITDEKLKEAVVVMNRDRRLKRELAGLMQSACPPLTGRELLGMRSLIAGLPQDHEQYSKAAAWLAGREIKPAAGKRVRVLLTGVPLPHGAERVLGLIEDNGGLVVCQESCSGEKPVLEDIDIDAPDLLRALAAKYFHLPCSVMTPNDRRLERLEALAGEYRAECVIEVVWRTCLTYDIEAQAVKALAEDKLRMPYLKIETDYSPSDNARLSLRVQSLFETVKGRQGCNHG